MAPPPAAGVGGGEGGGKLSPLYNVLSPWFNVNPFIPWPLFTFGFRSVSDLVVTYGRNETLKSEKVWFNSGISLFY